MIVKSTWRRAGSLKKHLLRTDTNEAVRVRTDLCRGANDLHAALRLMDALARTNLRAERSFVHVVISPDHVLTDAELAETLAMIEAEHGLSSVLRAVVEHLKGARAPHFHAVYPVVDPETGKAARSHGNFERDELISRRLELAFGERVTPGPRIEQNVTELRRRGLDAEADRLSPYLPVRHQDPLSRADRQQASRLGVKALEWSARAFVLFEGAGRDLATFAARLEAAGLSVARGTKDVSSADDPEDRDRRVVMLVDDATGYSTSLVRLLRREAKGAGRPLAITEREVGAAFPAAPPFEEARDIGLERARARAGREVEVERRSAIYDALADGDVADLEAFRVRRRKAQDAADAQAQVEFRATLKARREAIQALYRERDAVRRRRVDRAFRAARVFATPAMRRLAFGLAAAGVLMTGGGLAMAMAGGLYAAHLVPSRARARSLAAAAQHDRRADAAARRAALDAAYRSTRDEQRKSTGHVRFSFDQVATQDRLLAGFYADALLRASDGDKSATGAAKAAADALGPVVAAGITRMLERGSDLQVRRLRHWYRGVAPSRRDAILAAALRRHVQGRSPGEKPPPTTASIDATVQRRQTPTKPWRQHRARDVGPGR